MGIIGWIVVGWVVFEVVRRTRARVVVRIEEGRARLVRGRLPGGLLGDLESVARMSPDVAGRVEIRGRGEHLSVRTSGLPDGPAQRARNVIHLRRDDV